MYAVGTAFIPHTVTAPVPDLYCACTLPVPQDMPGWGDDINLVRYLKVVLSYILEQRAKVMTNAYQFCDESTFVTTTLSTCLIMVGECLRA
jgi:hypothetical protein